MLVIAIINARVVDGDAIARATAQQVIDRLAGVLPQQVPQRDVNCRDRARFCPGEAKEVYGGKHVGPVVLDVEGRLADQQVRQHVVDDRGDRSRRVERLAEADEPVVGVNPKPQRIRLSIDPDGFQLLDLHTPIPHK